MISELKGKHTARPWFSCIVLAMKLTVVLLVAAVLQVSAKGYSQQVTINEKDITVTRLLQIIEKQTGYQFLYDKLQMKNIVIKRVEVSNASVEQVLNKSFEGLSLSYKIIRRTIVVKRNRQAATVPVVENTEAPAKQDIVITGLVMNAEGEPLANVSVLVKGKSVGTTTNSNGEFSIGVPDEKAVLLFSYVGYKNQEVIVGSQKNIRLVLQPETGSLEDVVVVGYGSQSKKKVTSSISEIRTSDLKDLPVTSSGQLLEGRASGLTVKQTDGAPGTSPTIMIHGISSINSGISPLIVVDGFPIGTEIPQSLNPNDIEKITVLKDAASASIYGARGSNGVVLIQTTKAKESHTEIEYNISGGGQYLPDSWLPKMLNAVQYAAYNKQVIEETNARNNTSKPVPQIFLDVLNNPDEYGNGTNWMHEFLRQGSDASFQNHRLTFRGGNKQIRGAMTGGYLSQKGILPNSDFKRYSMRTNVEGNFAKWFKVAGNISIAGTNTNTVSDRGPRGMLMAAVTASPLKSPYDQNGDLIPYIEADVPGYFAFPNPLYEAQVEKNRMVGRDASAGLNADIEIIKGLHYKPQVYARMYTQEQNTFVPTTVGVFAIGSAADLSPGAPPYVNAATNQKFDVTNWGVDNLLTYDKTLGRHSLSVLAGYTAQKQSGELSQINASNFPTDNNINFLEASQVSASVSDYTNWSLAAFFGRINYDYDGKYLVDLNFRREGSSRFGKNNKYGNFPSASIGWRISQEDFYPENALVNELKLRASFGKTGNSSIGDFDRLGTVLAIPNLNNLNNNYNYVLNDAIVTGRALTSLGNESLKWETARQTNVGVTLGLLHDRITIKADYFTKTTEDMLFDISLPQASGFSTTRVNIGEMTNKGWDFEVNAIIGQRNFTWSTNLNLSLLHNEVTSMPSEISKLLAPYTITEVGKPVGSLYGYQIDGIFNSEEAVNDPKLNGWSGAKKLGAYIYRDMNGDGKIDATDQTNIGNPHPKAVLGFNNIFTYRNFSLSILATGAFGYQIMPEINEVLYNEKQRWNVSAKFLRRWRSVEDPGDGLIPAVYYPGQHSPSNIWVENGDHIWIKNITLGYKLPSNLVNKVSFISGLRFYISVQNVLKITNYTGWNPEVSYYGGGSSTKFGVDNFSYPVSRTFTVGASISL